MFPITFILFALLSSAPPNRSHRSDGPDCLDENGRPVDWYLAYKFPSVKTSHELESGLRYSYITSETVKHANTRLSEFGRSSRARRSSSNVLRWILSEKPITSPESAIMRTLAIAYDKKSPKTASTILYNDGVGKDVEISRWLGHKAHAKGVVIMDDTNDLGIWLVHSVPKFSPNLSQPLAFEDNVRYNGQVFMCISFHTRDTAQAIVDHLYMINPIIYDHYITPGMYKLIPKLNDLVPAHEGITKRRRSVKDGQVFTQVIQTRAGEHLKVFSKSSRFGRDLYADWMEDELQTSLYVATWRKGTGNPLPSACPANRYHINNVLDFRVQSASSEEISWPAVSDHGKWAISDEAEHGLVCIADINRMESQFSRGGGAVCIKCPTCWTVFSNTILDTEPCPIHG